MLSHPIVKRRAKRLPTRISLHQSVLWIAVVLIAGAAAFALAYFDVGYRPLATALGVVLLAIVTIKAPQFALGVASVTPILDPSTSFGTLRLLVVIVVFVILRHRVAIIKWTRGQDLVFPIVFLGVSYLLLWISSVFGQLTNSHSVALQFLVLGFAACGVGVVVAADPEPVISRRHVLDGLLAGILASSLYGAVQGVGLAPAPLQGEVLTGGRAVGLYPESDFLGVFCVIGIVLIISGVTSLSRKGYLPALVILVAALTFSAARAAWLSVAFAVPLILLQGQSGPWNGIRSRLRVLSYILVAMAVSVVVVLLAPQNRQADLIRRLESISSQSDSDSSRRARLLQTSALSGLAESAPWYGYGLTASGRVAEDGRLALGDEYRNNVGSNWIYSIWLESKYLSLPFFLAMSIALYLNRRDAVSVVLAVILVNSLFTNILWYSVTPCVIGLAYANVSGWSLTKQKISKSTVEMEEDK